MGKCDWTKGKRETEETNEESKRRRKWHDNKHWFRLMCCCSETKSNRFDDLISIYTCLDQNESLEQTNEGAREKKMEENIETHREWIDSEFVSRNWRRQCTWRWKQSHFISVLFYPIYVCAELLVSVYVLPFFFFLRCFVSRKRNQVNLCEIYTRICRNNDAFD